MTQALDKASTDPQREPFLVALGERVRRLRAIRGMTRKALAQATGVSERHLANLEHGLGNHPSWYCCRSPAPSIARWRNWWATSPPNRPNGC